MVYKNIVVMGHVRIIAGSLTVRYGRFFPINVPESTKTHCNKQIMRKSSTIFTHICFTLTLETAPAAF